MPDISSLEDPFNKNRKETWDTIESLFFQLCKLPLAQHSEFFKEHKVDEELQVLLTSLILNFENTHPFLSQGIKETFANALFSSQPQEWIGQRFGDFDIVQVLGKGGSGIVLKAEQKEPVQRYVAIKMIYQQAPRSFFERFNFEQASLAKLNHPNIATIYSVGFSPDGTPYLAMEYIEGKTLLEHCDRNKLGIKQRLSLFLQICRGISYSHQYGILHRDIKPENILVRNLSTGPIPVVIDFGIATNLDSQREVESEGSKIGTPEFMSPEHLSGLEQMDVRSDIYSLGMLLFSLLVGKPEFQREKFNSKSPQEKQSYLNAYRPESMQEYLASCKCERLNKIAKLRGLSVTQFKKAVDEEVDWIYKKATAKKKEDRYGSVSELDDDLNRLFNNKPLTAAKESKRYELKKLIQRNAAISVSFVAVLSIIVIFSIVTLRQNQVIKQQFQIAENQREIAERQKEVAVSEKQSADQISKLLGEIFTNVNPRFAQRSNNNEKVTILEAISKGRNRINQNQNLTAEVKFPLLFTIAYTYFGLGETNDSITILNSILDRGQWPNDTLDASAHWLLSRSYALDNLHEKSFVHGEAAYNLLPNSNLDEVRQWEIISNLATRYEHIHDIENAILYSNQSRNLAGRVFGTSSFRAIEEEAYYASILASASRFKEAKLILHNTLMKYQRLPEEQKHALTYLYLLARQSDTLVRLGEYEQGIAYQEEAVEVAGDTLGTNHKQYVTALNGLATYYFAAGLFDRAILLGEQVLNLSAKTDGEGSMNFLINKTNLGIRYTFTGKYSTGSIYLQSVLNLSKQYYPNDLFNLAYVHLSLAQNYMGSKNLVKARSYVELAKSGFEQTVGTKSIYYASTLMCSALVDFMDNDLESGSLSLLEAKDIFDDMLDKTHKHIALANIASAYANYQLDGNTDSLIKFEQQFSLYKNRKDATMLFIELFEDLSKPNH
ncbi:serine/threonine protein kinase [Alteromonadaceae bacterium M269]|nr:serine/threonine protein kinase [Alteromonadaceae bacterium M269]